MSDRSDVCIAGGGIIGLAIGYELARRGQQITVLEAQGVGEQAAAGVAAGMLAPYGEVSVAHPELTKLATASHDLYPGFIEELEALTGMSTRFDQTGTLFVAAHRDHAAPLIQLEAFLRERGMAAERLSGPEARDLEPALAPAVSAGLLLADDWQVDPRRLMRALSAAITKLGGTIRERARVRGVERGDGMYHVRYGEPVEVLTANRVVIAAGAWSEDIERGPEQLPLRPVRGEILRLRGERLIQRVVRSPGVYLVPRVDGELVVGATSEERGFDGRLLAGSVLELLRESYRLAPGIYDMELAESQVGFRPALRDHLPAMGRLDEDGLFIATGHFRNGVELAPISAQIMGSLLCGETADEPWHMFSPQRFVTRTATATATGR